MELGLIIGIVAIILSSVLIIFGMLAILATRLKKCPPDKIMVVYGGGSKNNKDGSRKTAKCVHGGASFVWPFFQGYGYLDLRPMTIRVDLMGALSKQNIRVDIPSNFTLGISTEPGVMQNAAERLRGMNTEHIQDLARDIIFGQLRLIVSTMDIEEINTDREKFLQSISINVETELKKVGLRLFNVNITDINDGSGYIVALGREAAAKAINEANKSVAEAVRDGESGVAAADKQKRISISSSNADAVDGENSAMARVSLSDATRREVQAEAERRATVAELIATANAKKDAYKAQQEAEEARALREKATMEADILVKQEIEKRRVELEAEAQAESIRRVAKGEADALFLKKSAEAKGLLEILTKQAEGFDKLVKAGGGNSDDAVKLLLSDKIEGLVALQVEAIKNIKIDQVTVWDSGQAANGGHATANFLSGMLKSVPPLQDIFKMSGMQLPEYLGKVVEKPQQNMDATVE
ncbi:MAG: flotillin family protein [Clostridiales bacterium]|jgi:flotillin|nr:flotillin family protein [Clostridiales bacterium]